LYQEIKKASNFFDQTEEIFLIREQRIKDAMQMMKQMQPNCYTSRKSKLTLSVVWFYKDLMALETFATMAYCCIVKIIKKIDKKIGLQVGYDFMNVVVNNANFVEYHRTKRMIQATHDFYEYVTEKILSAQNVYLQSDENLFIDALSRLHVKKVEALKYSGNVKAIFETSTQNKVAETHSSALSLRSNIAYLGLCKSEDKQNYPVADSDHIALSTFGVATRLDFDSIE
jgi:hypothetical protein